MLKKAPPGDFPGRFREIIADPLNLLIHRHPQAGVVAGQQVILHNGNRVFVEGPAAYYGGFSQILILNRGVHEPLEEFAFQELLPHLPRAPVMLELGAYWAHYSMWLKRRRPDAVLYMVEPEPDNARAGRANLALNGMAGTYVEDFVARGRFTVDDWFSKTGHDRLDILHCDIQGYEDEMLDCAGQALDRKKVDYWFISTHSQALHESTMMRMQEAGYRIEVSADFAHETTSFDGFFLAVNPDRPPVLSGVRPLGREALARADPARLIGSLLPWLEGLSTGAEDDASQ